VPLPSGSYTLKAISKLAVRLSIASPIQFLVNKEEGKPEKFGSVTALPASPPEREISAEKLELLKAAVRAVMEEMEMG